MYKGLLRTLLLFSLCQGAVAAQIVYVHDQIRLGVRGAPNSAEKSIAVVKTGDRLEVLEERDKFIRVRTEKGIEGWVTRSYVNKEMPARLRLEELQQQQEKLSSELTELQQQLADAREKKAVSQKQLAALKVENASLNKDLGAYIQSEAEEKEKESNAWIYQAATLLALFIGGVVLGVRWDRRRVADRIGGLEI
jgi:SH3 domain protein